MMKNTASMILPEETSETLSNHSARLTSYVKEIIDAYNRNDFNDMLLELLMLREIVTTHMDPANLSFGLVDILMDENMWEWILKAIKKDDLNSFDKEALSLIVADLQDLVDRDELVLSDPNMDA
jgi:hypothetical protein